MKLLNGLCLGGSCLRPWTPQWARAEPMAVTQEHHQLVMLLYLCGPCDVQSPAQSMDRAAPTLSRLSWDSRWSGTHSGGSPRILLLSTVTTTTFLCAKQLLSHWATFQAPCFVERENIISSFCVRLLAEAPVMKDRLTKEQEAYLLDVWYDTRFCFFWKWTQQINRLNLSIS